MERELTTNEKKLKDMTSFYHRLKSEHDEMVVSVKNLFLFFKKIYFYIFIFSLLSPPLFYF
jgi:hypothetical protein